ncbi:hypothetical protein [Banduia mediterranea]|uniref:hypothetical protein n=1 Tax=Banduia mediterranea TaxID=3075609 RepID=UPI003D76EF5A
MQERAEVQLEQLFDRARAKGKLDESLQPGTAALALHAYMLGVYCSWLRAPTSYSLGDQAASLLGVFFNGPLRRSAGSRSHEADCQFSCGLQHRSGPVAAGSAPASRRKSRSVRCWTPHSE